MPEEPTPLTAEELKNFKPIDDTGRSAKQNIYTPPGGKQNASAPIDSSTLEKLRGILLGAPGAVQYGQMPPQKSYNVSRDDVVNFLRPMAFPAAVAGTTALLSPAVGVPLALAGGIGAGVAGDIGLQQTLNKPEQRTLSNVAKSWSGWEGFAPGKISSQIANTAEMALVNEAGGRVIGKGLQAAKQELTPQAGSAAAEFIQKFKPSVSQFMEHMFGASPGQRLSQWVENTFATGTKRALQESQYDIAAGEAGQADIKQRFQPHLENIAEQQTAQLELNAAKFKGSDLASQLAGRPPRFFEQTPQDIVQIQKEALKGNYYKSLRTSNSLGEFVKSEAKNNTIQVQGLPEDSQEVNILSQAFNGKSYAAQTPQDKQMLLSEFQKMGLQLPTRSVSGPVNPTNGVQTALKILKAEGFDFANQVPSDNPIIRSAQGLLKAAQYHVDETGAPHFDPISFEDAWSLKHITGNFGYGTRAVGTKTLPIYRDTRFKTLEQSVSHDIDSALAQWGSPEAQVAWKDSKSIIAQRHILFDQRGNGVRELIQSTNDSIPELDRIINDSHKLQTALSAGNLQLSAGEFSSTNLRQDLRGYRVAKYFQDPYVKTDPLTGNTSFNYERMSRDFNRPDRQASMEKLYSSSERSEINQFFKNIAEQQKKATAPIDFPAAQGAGELKDQTNTLLAQYGLPNKPIPAGSGINAKLMVIRGGILLGPSIIGHFAGFFHNPAYGAGLVGVGLGGLASGKILTNKTVVRLAASALSGQPVGDKLLAREIFGALQGTGAQITLSMQDGSSVRGTLENDGFKPLSDLPVEK